jgi:hypothetical protein
MPRSSLLEVVRTEGDQVTWVILVAPDLVAELKSELGALAGPGLRIVVAATTTMTPARHEIDLSGASLPSPPVLTFRLDSDDALLASGVRAARAAVADAPEGTLVDLSRGVQLDLETGRLVELQFPPWRQGPFFALLGRGDTELALDLSRQHPQARHGRAVRRLDAPAWVQGIHGDNVSNSMAVAGPAVRLKLASSRVRSLAAARAAWRTGRHPRAALRVEVGRHVDLSS